MLCMSVVWWQNPCHCKFRHKKHTPCWDAHRYISVLQLHWTQCFFPHKTTSFCAHQVHLAVIWYFCKKNRTWKKNLCACIGAIQRVALLCFSSLFVWFFFLQNFLISRGLYCSCQFTASFFHTICLFAIFSCFVLLSSTTETIVIMRKLFVYLIYVLAVKFGETLPPEMMTGKFIQDFYIHSM